MGFRYGLIEWFAASELQFVAWVIALAPLIAIDGWTFFCVSVRQQAPGWLGAALAAALAMAVNLPLIRRLYDIEPSPVLVYALAVVITGIGMSWLSHQIADWMTLKQETGALAESPRIRRALGVLGGFAVFMMVFILTATPPA